MPEFHAQRVVRPLGCHAVGADILVRCFHLEVLYVQRRVRHAVVDMALVDGVERVFEYHFGGQQMQVDKRFACVLRKMRMQVYIARIDMLHRV